MAFVICFDSRVYSKEVLYSFSFLKVKNSDEASVLFWNWLLQYTQLSPKTAAMHNIFEEGSSAVFFDLDDDGEREIIATHNSTDIFNRGSCYLYILKFDASKVSKYRLISGDLTFDISKPLYVLSEKKNGYHIIKAKSQRSGRNKFFIFDSDEKLYKEK